MGVLMEIRQGRYHQMCSFVGGQLLDHVSFKKSHLETMSKDLMEAERSDLDPEPASLWWASTSAHEMMEDITISTRAGRHTMPFEKSVQDTPSSWQGRRKTAWKRERESATCKQGLVERCEDLQKQTRVVEGEESEKGGAWLQCLLLWKRKWALGVEPSWTELKDGRRNKP